VNIYKPAARRDERINCTLVGGKFASHKKYCFVFFFQAHDNAAIKDREVKEQMHVGRLSA